MREKPDHYTIKAKKEGYPARSVYKLKEIDEKNALISRGNLILDVGAAPGSWSIYASRRAGKNGKVVAVDLQEMPALQKLPNVNVIVGDVFEGAVQEQIFAPLGEGAMFDIIMSDAAPATTGNRTVDTARSSGLVEHILGLCPNHLKKGGHFVAKIFQGGDEQTLLADLRKTFQKAKLFKPKACRSESFETFLVGLGYVRG